ncbi:hypothetical protein [Gracilibacillus thailandensis]|uniref:Zinc-finger domain-containing protein n=1 Tax=Gracilibacillus thailandensis TaxID=563735 RepID=A0A6N7R352_9BACI|nr:hypothetical protein [Gracilibacillus thailandensis]MRI66566.1 hypothetical protein [Gracilibacillus thailandensis]
MKHMTRDALLAYINAESNQETEVENHLLECETCTDLYLSIVEEVEMNSGVSADFTDDTLQQLEIRLPAPPQKKQNHVFIHYLVAAGLTILLTITGVFQGALDVSDIQQKKGGSITDHLMTKTDNVLQEIKGVHRHE